MWLLNAVIKLVFDILGRISLYCVKLNIFKEWGK